MEAEIKITETLLKHARALRDAADPDEAIAAAKWEKKFDEELERLRKASRKMEAAAK